MSTPLTIVAQIEAKADHIRLVKTELLKLVAITLEEEGCIQYQLHQDNDRPELFLFYEKWQNRELWQQHMANDHLQAYMAATEGAVANFVLNEMTSI